MKTRSPLKIVLVWLLKAYRFAISPLYGQVCRYHPTCSAYALQAVETHGAIRGVYLAARRVAVDLSFDPSVLPQLQKMLAHGFACKPEVRSELGDGRGAALLQGDNDSAAAVGKLLVRQLGSPSA